MEINTKGDFKNDEMVGNGKFTVLYDNGDKYVGDYYNLQRHGRGKNYILKLVYMKVSLTKIKKKVKE